MTSMLNQEEKIFDRAIEITDERQRSEYLDQACADNPELRRRVDGLLQMHDSSGRILDETREGSLRDSVLAALPHVGDMIGPYKLLEEIGEGGMGMVFMAEQTSPVRRKVAVKVIKVGMDTRRVVARFESERQALAMMDHPSITKVLDAGATESGRPYFVMDLVRGKSITTYCDAKRVSLPERLKIFAKVCDAVEHAHQKGIIHRDIKPTNIMVTSNDGVPLPKIIDFGIAKATNDRLTEKTLFTKYGEMIGTPLYMSPEQAEMSEPDVDTLTDVYSLGVVMYELVTGSTPFGDLKDKSFHKIREAIRSSDPVLASTRISRLSDTANEITENRSTDQQSLQRFVRGELDWILGKCLARDRRNRYQSAGELAREIRRYLNGEPVEAAKPTLAYRTRKFIARHRSAAAAIAAVFVVLCASTAVSTTMAMRARKAENLANARLQQVMAQRDRAQRAEQQLAAMEHQQRKRAAWNQAVAMHNANMVKQHLASEPQKAAGRGATIQVKPMSRVWSTERRGQPEVRISAQPTSGLGAQTGAFQFETLSFSDDQDNEFLEVVVMDDESESQADLLKCLAKAQRQAFGSGDAVVAITLNQLGEVMSRQENWVESEECFREAMKILENVDGMDPEYLSEIRLKLVDCLSKKGDIEKALSELKECQETLRKAEIAKDLNRLIKRHQQTVESEDQDR